MTFAELLRSHLVAIDLSSKSASKFRDLTEAVEAFLGVEGLVIKALAAPKNFGNRISEATADGRALIVVAEGDVDLDALERAYVGRALNHVPMLLVSAATGDDWHPRAVWTAGEQNPFPADIPTFVLDLQVDGPRLDGEGVQAVVEAVRRCDGSDWDAGVASLLQLAEGSSGLAAKFVGDAKNAHNRVREAMGRRPGVFVAIGDHALKEQLSRSVEANKELTGWGFLALQREGRLELIEVSAPTEEEIQMQGSDELDEYEPGGSDDAVEELQYQVNATVADLTRYLPFDATAGNLYEEHISSSQRLEFDTSALGFIHALVKDPEVSMVVLTGNAGHGKTHLCRRLLSEAGLKPREAMAAMSGDLRGESPIELPGLPRRIRILKDLSEIEPVASAAERLVELLEDTDTLAIVCANEGRLRAAVSVNPGRLGLLVRTLEAGIRDGATCIEPTVHVVNLNFQAVAPTRGEAFLDFALDHWVGHKNRWKKCESCLAGPDCPILANRTALSLSPETRQAARPVRDSLTHLVRLAEQTGYVLTIREALILVAFLVTGGLDCPAVHGRHRLGDLDGFGYLDSLFERQLPDTDMSQLGVLERIRRFDPGRVAMRSVDERLHEELERSGAFGSEVLEVGARPPSTRDQLRREQMTHLDSLRRARRRDFFTHVPEELGRSTRLGLRFHDDFLALQSHSLDDAKMLAILERLVAGLHVVQGVRTSSQSAGLLYLVDPAFSRSSNRSAVIAHQFDQTNLELVGEAQFWTETDGEPQLLEAVDWLDRRVVLAHREQLGSPPAPILDFDLLQFEFVMRSAAGVVFNEFNAAERKRIVSRLARIAEERKSPRDIKVMEGGRLRRLILERDNSFRVAST
ncbi:MAG: hypothetical protein EP330_08520 [Deltaproteobacteria bacterium]|nr:MAG: hypothetical protein EP330_08520 [Deltaproteobacteria bacterium]